MVPQVLAMFVQVLHAMMTGLIHCDNPILDTCHTLSLCHVP